MESARSQVATSSLKGLNIAAWIVQVLLAVAFGSAGVMKLSQPIEVLAATLGWPGAVPPAMVRVIGLSELVGALGLILPAVTRVKPALTALAALGLTTVMVLASGFHVLRGEFTMLPVTLVLGGLAVFVAWVRWTAVPIASR